MGQRKPTGPHARQSATKNFTYAQAYGGGGPDGEPILGRGSRYAGFWWSPDGTLRVQRMNRVQDKSWDAQVMSLSVRPCFFR